METNKEFKAVRVPCSNCGGDYRNHDIVGEFSDHLDNGVPGERGNSYQICRCKGCDGVRFRINSWSFYEESVTTIYPEALESKRSRTETRDLPKAVAQIYSETVIAFNAGAHTLSGGGLRTIVEAICIDQKVSGNNLQDKIDDLVEKGLLAKPQADLLHEERYIGNAALHEILPPSKQEIEDGLDIVEGLMNTIYVLPLRAERLRNQRESRTKGEGKPASTGRLIK